jgi:hypothetical protein
MSENMKLRQTIPIPEFDNCKISPNWTHAASYTFQSKLEAAH